MPDPASRIGRRHLLFVLLLAVVLVAAIDLLRPDSLLRDLWSSTEGAGSPLREVLDDLRFRGPGY